MSTRIVVSTLVPEMSPFSEADESCPSSSNCLFRLYPPRTPRNWAESIPVLSELTSLWPNPNPISPPPLPDVLPAKAGTPINATSAAQHRIRFIRVLLWVWDRVPLSRRKGAAPKGRDANRLVQADYENVALPAARGFQ